MWVRVRVLGGGWLAVVFDPGDCGFAEETVLVVHQMLVDTGFAGLVGTGFEHSRDGVSVADGTEVFFTGRSCAGCSLFGLLCEERQHQLHLVFFLLADVVGVCVQGEVFALRRPRVSCG